MFKKRPNAGGGEGVFLKLEAGKPVTGVFKEPVKLFLSHFLGQGKGSAECLGDECDHCAQRLRASERFRVNFITKDQTGTYVSKIFEGSGTVYDTLTKLEESGYQLETTPVRVTKEGTGTQTKTHILPLPPNMITEGSLEAISRVPLQPLERKTSQDKPTFAARGDSDYPSMTEENIPF